jgi:hypothetical protein
MNKAEKETEENQPVDLKQQLEEARKQAEDALARATEAEKHAAKVESQKVELEQDIAAIKRDTPGGKTISQLQYERKIHNNWQGVDYRKPWCVIGLSVKDPATQKEQPANGKMEVAGMDKIRAKKASTDYPTKEYKNIPNWIYFDNGVGVTNNFLLARELAKTHILSGGITEYSPIEDWKPPEVEA